MVTGTTGRSLAMAMRNAPFLKSARMPSSLRVPSGNTMIECPRSLAAATPRLIWAWAAEDACRSVSMMPMRRIAWASRGILNSSFLARNRIGTGAVSSITGMS
jgi:hypothetical protein